MNLVGRILKPNLWREYTIMHRLEISNAIDFLSKRCKDNEHQKCYGNWVGLGIRVDCNCLCHHNKKITDTKWMEIKGNPVESDRNVSMSVVESNAELITYSELNDLKKNIEPVDESLRGSSQQVHFAKGKE